jgi:hypothetical protein
MGRHHVIISGTGRAGTTFLVQLFTELGLDTGFDHSNARVHEHCNAGMEQNIRNPDAPYIVKSPTLCEYLDEVLDASAVVVDYAIIPIRDLYSAAESRRDVFRRSSRKAGIPGGLWLTKNPHAQEAVLAQEFHKLIHTLTKHDVPTIWLYFPRFVNDPEYLYQKLRPVLPAIEQDAFLRAFQAVSRPELVHDFENRQDSPAAPKSFLARLRDRWSF